jgi:hypothetical protein
MAYGNISGSVAYTDSGEGGGFLSAGPGLGTNPGNYKEPSFNLNIYQNTNPYDNYMHFSDFAGWQQNNSLSVPVPQLRSNINANWGSGSTYNYFGIGVSSLSVPALSTSTTYTPEKTMLRVK